MSQPPPATETWPVIAAPPVLLIVTLHPPTSLIPAIVSGAEVLVNDIDPLAVLVKLIVPTAFAPPSVWPVAELVVNVPVVLIKPAPDSVIAALAVIPIAEPPAATEPVMAIEPVLLTVTAAPVCEMPVIVSVAAVFVGEIAPPFALVAFKLPTVFAFDSVVPPTELVCSNPVVLNVPDPDSAIEPPALMEIWPEVLLTAAVSEKLFDPVVLNATVPLPPAVTLALTVSAPVVAVTEIFPLAVVVMLPLTVTLPTLLMLTLPPPD